MEFILLSILSFLLWNYCYNLSQSGLTALILFQKEIQTVKTTVDYANFIYYKNIDMCQHWFKGKLQKYSRVCNNMLKTIQYSDAG